MKGILIGLVLAVALGAFLVRGNFFPGDSETGVEQPAPRPASPGSAQRNPLPRGGPAAALGDVQLSEDPGLASLYLLFLRSPELTPDVRAWVASELGQLDSPEVTEGLIQALDDTEIKVVLAAVNALATHDDPKARSALEARAAHYNPVVSLRVREILETAPND